MSSGPIVQKRLVLLDDEPEEIADETCDFRCDGVSSLVALALEHKLPLFSDGVTANASALTVRAGHGAFAIVNISRLSIDISGQERSWQGEEHFFGPSRIAGSKVAVKNTLQGGDLSLSQSLTSMANEIRVLGHPHLRNHQNIVDIIGVGWGGTLYDDPECTYRWPILLLEFASCGTLEDFFTLEDLDYTWEIKEKICYDVANGLEALDDACVLHGDLKLSNVLVFRTGLDNFTAKVCDFGSAMISTDFDSNNPVRQVTFTPPWDAPESSENIALDDLYKVDVYSYGLLVCRTFIEGADPFDLRFRTEPPPSESSKKVIISQWKRNDEVVDICKYAVRNTSYGRYTSEQLAILDSIFDVTVRTDINVRVNEYLHIKNILKPDFFAEEAQKREEFSLDTIESEIIPPIFSGDLSRSIPDTERCLGELLPKNIAVEIVDDLIRIASVNLPMSLPPNLKARVAAAAYELSLCYIQGFGCSTSHDHAARWLTLSAELGSIRGQNNIYNMFQALKIPFPDSLSLKSTEWIINSAISGSERALTHLQKLDPILYSSTKRDIRTIYGGLGIDIFGDEIRTIYNLQNPHDFLEKINYTNNEIISEDEDTEGLTWLHYAASNGSFISVQLLICNGDCEIDCVTQDSGWTPLWMACAAGHFDVAMLLLDNGANAKAASEIGYTCLHFLQAFDAEFIERIAVKLLDSGADIEAKAVLDGATPLANACLYAEGKDSTIAVKVLIQCGANPLTLSVRGYSPMDMAAMSLHPDILRILLKSPSFSGADGEELAVHARAKALKCLVKQPKYYRFLNGGLSYQLNLNEVLHILISQPVIAAYMADFPECHTPLHDACIWGATDLVEPLLSFPEIDINSFTGKPNETNLPPLFKALLMGNEELAKLLVAHGADITAKDSSGRNILHFVAEFVPDLLLFFLNCLRDMGCEIRDLVNAGTVKQGFAPLDLAIRAEHFEHASTLLSCGAQYDEFTRHGQAGEHYTSLGSVGGSKRQMSYLLDLQPPYKRPSLVVCDNGFTLFHLTAASFDNALLETDPSLADNIIFLLDHYATQEDANRRDLAGNTPLHIAAFFGNTAVARVLLDSAGADVNARNKKGATPLDILGAGRKNQEPDLKELKLVDDIERRTWRRRTEEMDNLLKRYGALEGSRLSNKLT